MTWEQKVFPFLFFFPFFLLGHYSGGCLKSREDLGHLSHGRSGGQGYLEAGLSGLQLTPLRHLWLCLPTSVTGSQCLAGKCCLFSEGGSCKSQSVQHWSMQVDFLGSVWILCSTHSSQGRLFLVGTVSARNVLLARGHKEQEEKVSILRKKFNEEDFCSFFIAQASSGLMRWLLICLHPYCVTKGNGLCCPSLVILALLGVLQAFPCDQKCSEDAECWNASAEGGGLCAGRAGGAPFGSGWGAGCREKVLQEPWRFGQLQIPLFPRSQESPELLWVCDSKGNVLKSTEAKKSLLWHLSLSQFTLKGCRTARYP